VRLFGFSESTLADELGFVGFFGGVSGGISRGRADVAGSSSA
jgi:hypothetical protein